MRVLLLILALVGLTACAPTVALEPAEEAADPSCASVIVALPDTIGEQVPGGPFDARTTDAQGTGAWGSPAVATLRCGVPEPAPTTAPCITVGEVDWIEVGHEGTAYTFVTYGRAPAVEIVLDADRITAATVLDALGFAVAESEAVGGCVDLTDAP